MEEYSLTDIVQEVLERSNFPTKTCVRIGDAIVVKLDDLLRKKEYPENELQERIDHVKRLCDEFFRPENEAVALNKYRESGLVAGARRIERYLKDTISRDVLELVRFTAMQEKDTCLHRESREQALVREAVDHPEGNIILFPTERSK